MLAENIRRARKSKGISQEQLATELHVVRQTVSKWENGQSVPDADALMRLAQALDTSVETLLDIPQLDSREDELALLRGELVRLVERQRRSEQAGQIRGLILLLSFATMVVALTVRNAVMSILLTVCCLSAALVILYKNLPLLTTFGAEARKLGAIKITTIFDIVLILLAAGTVILSETSVLQMTEEREELLAYAIISAVMLFGGWVSPRLPFNRHTGLRLPWTVTDEQTWNVAHRVLGYISLPLTLLYTAAAFTVESFDAVTAAAVCLWVGIPGLISLLFWRQKFR